MLTPEDRAENYLRKYEEGIEANNTDALKEAWKLYRDASTPEEVREKLATAIDFMISKL